jgi:hypothetical protein
MLADFRLGLSVALANDNLFAGFVVVICSAARIFVPPDCNMSRLAAAS